MVSALIGYTGFVGGNLHRQAFFDALFNSKNISDIRGREFDLVICAGAPAAKWIANQHPEDDLANINNLIENLRQTKTRRFILISTVDVYPVPVGVDEASEIAEDALQPYGRHRLHLEHFVTDAFPNANVVRLPGLFGRGIKKNFIYDLIHDNYLQGTHRDSAYQFYGLERLWRDLQVVLENEAALINFGTEAVSAKQVAARCFDRTFENVTEAPPAVYDMRTRFAHLFGRPGSPYLRSAEEVLEELRQFVQAEQTALRP